MNEFDEVVNRSGFQSLKYDELQTHFSYDDVIPMWVADMDFRVAPCIIEALNKRVDHGVFGYAAIPSTYFDSVRHWYLSRYHWDIPFQNITHSPSVITSLMILVSQLTHVGDAIIVQTPVYTPFKRVIESQNRKMILNPLKRVQESYQMDFEDLDEKIKKHNVKLLILCNPHNPVGRVWHKHELATLHEICQRHHVQVISDEIHADLTYEHLYTPYQTIDTHCITCLSSTKTFNLAGLQGSFVVGESLELFKEFTQLYHLKRPNVMSIVANTAAYQYGEPWVESLKLYLKQNIQDVIEYLALNMPQLTVIKPEGTYLVWIDCNALNMNDTLHAFFLTQAKIAFEASDFIEGGDGFIRMNVACTRERLFQALKQMKEAIDQLERGGSYE